MFNKKFLLSNTINLNYSTFEYYKNHKLSGSSNFKIPNYISKQILFTLTKKQQHFFFYSEKAFLFPYYMYTFETYKQLFLFGDWYAGYLTNYVNIRANLLNSRSFSNLLFLNFFKTQISLFSPQAFIFLNFPKDSAAFSEFKKIKALCFEDPQSIAYKNSYFFLSGTTFHFFFNLYLILFQLKQTWNNKQLRLRKKNKKRFGIKTLASLKTKFLRCRFFFYNA